MWLLELFVVVQAGTAVPAAWLNRRRLIPPAVVVVTGGVLAAAGLPGLVYSTGVATAANWFSESRA